MSLDAMNAAFSKLPHWQPLMSVNLSETSAARRLLQIPFLGLFENDIHRKLYKDDCFTTDISPEVKKLMRNIVAEVDNALDVNPKLSSSGWKPVLYLYELYTGHAQRETDYGWLVFSDNTCSRFLLVRPEGSIKCSNGHCPLDHDYAEICELQAQQFFALAKYLPIPEPKWVRATFTSDEHRALPQDFLPLADDSALSSRLTEGLIPGIAHIAASNFSPCLTAGDLVALDALLQTSKQPMPGEEVKQRVLVSKGQPRPSYSPVFMPPEITGEAKRGCTGCRQVFKAHELKRCSGCKAVFYCSVACQHQHWKYHRSMCKSGEKAKE
ncbi:hypothetical protein JCM8097_001559 [Rhodosporidiobolus ruineniae]